MKAQPENVWYKSYYNNTGYDFRIDEILYANISKELYTFQVLETPAPHLTISKFTALDNSHNWTKSYDIETFRGGYGMTTNEAYIYAIEEASAPASSLHLGLFIAYTGVLQGFYKK